ncbi:MAG: hypothetical protein NYU90_07045 [Aigarchaeota archaeon]|nr:hypothetical protein [Candidatus Calditenuis fumarioli]
MDAIGRSEYSLTVEMPDEVRRGSPINLTFTLVLEKLPPLKHYSGYISLTFTLISPDGRTLARRTVTTRDDAYKVDYVYPGYRWGPFTTSIMPDYSIAASDSIRVVVTLESEEYAEDPLGIPVIPTRPTPAVVEIGTVRVSSDHWSYVTPLLLLSVALLLVSWTAFLLRRRYRKLRA